jgi:hypothetical protein
MLSVPWFIATRNRGALLFSAWLVAIVGVVGCYDFLRKSLMCRALRWLGFLGLKKVKGARCARVLAVARRKIKSRSQSNRQS